MTRERPSPKCHQLSPLFSDPDLVDRIFEYILEQVPELGGDRLQQLKRATRDEFAGVESYIPSRTAADRQAQVREVLRLFNGQNASEIARRLGIGRATVYRWLKQAGAGEKAGI